MEIKLLPDCKSNQFVGNLSWKRPILDQIKITNFNTEIYFRVMKFIQWIFSVPNIELKKIDWFHETETHRHFVMALNNLELRLYNSLPTSWADWDHPAHILPLLGTSILLQKGLKSPTSNFDGYNQISDTLVIRTGTRKEVEIRQFQGANLKAWLHAINEAKYLYVEKVEEALVEIVYKQETAFLGMHRLEGFKLYQITPDGKRPKGNLIMNRFRKNIADIYYNG